MATDLEGMILVVDDEASIKNAATRAISSLFPGKVQSASNAEEALVIAQHHRIDLLFTDVTMPGMHGADLSRHIRALYPEAHVIYASGSYDIERITLLPGAPFLQKPYGVQQLKDLVRSTLDKAYI